MPDVSGPAPMPRLAAISFDDDLRAVEFMTAVTRLARDGTLALHDAVFVVKDANGRTHIRETKDLQTGPTALSVGLWSGLFGLFLGGPVGMLIAGGIGAGAGAVTAKLVDVGVTDEFVAQLREMVQPGTTTVAVLADDVHTDAVLAELERFEGARYVAGNLPLAGIQAVRTALGDTSATSGAAFPPPAEASGDLTRSVGRGTRPHPDRRNGRSGGAARRRRTARQREPAAPPVQPARSCRRYRVAPPGVGRRSLAVSNPTPPEVRLLTSNNIQSSARASHIRETPCFAVRSPSPAAVGGTPGQPLLRRPVAMAFSVSWMPRSTSSS